MYHDRSAIEWHSERCLHFAAHPLHQRTAMFSCHLQGELEVFRALPHGFINFQMLPGAPSAVATMLRWVMAGLQLAA